MGISAMRHLADPFAQSVDQSLGSAYRNWPFAIFWSCNPSQFLQLGTNTPGSIIGQDDPGPNEHHQRIVASSNLDISGAGNINAGLA